MLKRVIPIWYTTFIYRSRSISSIDVSAMLDRKTTIWMYGRNKQRLDKFIEGRENTDATISHVLDKAESFELLLESAMKHVTEIAENLKSVFNLKVNPDQPKEVEASLAIGRILELLSSLETLIKNPPKPKPQKRFEDYGFAEIMREIQKSRKEREKK